MRVAALCAALVTVLATAVPAQAQESCTWRPTDLPLPANATSGYVTAASPDGRYFAGETFESQLLLWHNGQLTELQGTEGSYRAYAVNGSGHVIGLNATGAFVHRDGTLEYLPVPAGRTAVATGINEAGDMIGYLDGGYTGILWKAAQPGTYELLSAGRPVGIDDAGRVAFKSGLIRSLDGTTVQLAGYPAITIEKFQGGRVIGRVDRQFAYLREWDLSGAVVRDMKISPSSPVGINRDGLLVSWYFKTGGGNTLGTWRNGTFLNDVGPQLRVMAVTDTGVLGGYREIVPDEFWGPATWTCS